MARPREFDEDDVLERAMNAFWDRGYEAISMADLVTSTGLSRSSIYQAFGNKRGMFDAALDHYLTERIGAMLAGLEAPDADTTSILDFFRMLDEAEVEGPEEFTLGCLITNTMTELGRADPGARTAGTQYLQRLRDAFLHALVASAPTAADAATRAELLAVLTLGTFVRARGSDRPSLSPSIATIAQTVMGDWD